MMLPKSLRHSHPRNCEGQPTETRPINKQQNSYGSKINEQMRKEIKEEMKAKYKLKQDKPEDNEVKQVPDQPKAKVIVKPPENATNPDGKGNI